MTEPFTNDAGLRDYRPSLALTYHFPVTWLLVGFVVGIACGAIWCH